MNEWMNEWMKPFLQKSILAEITFQRISSPHPDRAVPSYSLDLRKPLNIYIVDFSAGVLEVDYYTIYDACRSPCLCVFLCVCVHVYVHLGFCVRIFLKWI